MILNFLASTRCGPYNLISMRFKVKRSVAVALQMLNRVQMQATEGSVNNDCEHFIINYFIKLR